MPLHQVVNVCSCVVHVELPLSVMYKYVRAYLINLTHHIYNIIVHVELALSVVYVCVQVP